MTEPTRDVDVSDLNEAERRVLSLLADGHTAKSAAVALGVSTAAVNERLRDARQKTGVGSSRELARILRAKQSRRELASTARDSGHVGGRNASAFKTSAKLLGAIVTLTVAFGVIGSDWAAPDANVSSLDQHTITSTSGSLSSATSAVDAWTEIESAGAVAYRAIGAVNKSAFGADLRRLGLGPAAHQLIGSNANTGRQTIGLHLVRITLPAG